MKRFLFFLCMGVLVLGTMATAGENRATHTVFVEFGTTTW